MGKPAFRSSKGGRRPSGRPGKTPPRALGERQLRGRTASQALPPKKPPKAPDAGGGRHGGQQVGGGEGGGAKGEPPGLAAEDVGHPSELALRAVARSRRTWLRGVPDNERESVAGSESGGTASERGVIVKDPELAAGGTRSTGSGHAV